MPTRVTVQNLYVFNSTLSKTEEDVSRNTLYTRSLNGITYHYIFILYIIPTIFNGNTYFPVSLL